MSKITEKHIVDYIITKGSLEILDKYDIKTTDFKRCSDYINYIIEYTERYNAVPDINSFKLKFKDYSFNEVIDNEKEIGLGFKETIIHKQVKNILEGNLDLLNSDSISGLNVIKEKLNSIKIPVENIDVGYDIVKNSKDRLERYERSKTEEFKKSIMLFNMKQIDTKLLGVEPADYIVILARTGVGKSWMAQYIGVNAWKQGKRVLYYSGEMDEESMGYRFDTWNNNFSNFSLRTGGEDLGQGKRSEDYKSYIEELSQKDGFLILTPHNMGGERATVKQIEAIALKWKADLIIIDQLSLMRDFRNTATIRERYNNISADILTSANNTGIPYIIVAQANRESTKIKEKDDEVNAPEVTHIMESDNVGQDAKKILSLAIKNDILNVFIRKSRNGGDDIVEKMKWNKDLGLLEPLLSNEELATIETDYLDETSNF